MKLIIAEKPSVAQTIAAALGATERKDGYIEGGGYVVSWCVGHLVGIDIDPDFLYLRCHSLYVGVVYLNDIAVYQHFPGVCCKVGCRYQLHFLLYQCAFCFYNGNAQGDCSFPVCHAHSSFPCRGFGKLPNKHFAGQNTEV